MKEKIKLTPGEKENERDSTIDRNGEGKTEGKAENRVREAETVKPKHRGKNRETEWER